MGLPYKVATLLFCFSDDDRILLMERSREPNRGYWSPPGGKLLIEQGESPYTAACREAAEELGLRVAISELHLTGIVAESGYGGAAHWLMFLFESRRKINTLPPEHPEGKFGYFNRLELDSLKNIPQTDRERIWPLFWEHRGGFFAASCQCQADGTNLWTVEESIRKT